MSKRAEHRIAKFHKKTFTGGGGTESDRTIISMPRRAGKSDFMRSMLENGDLWYDTSSGTVTTHATTTGTITIDNQSSTYVLDGDDNSVIQGPPKDVSYREGHYEDEWGAWQ